MRGLQSRKFEGSISRSEGEELEDSLAENSKFADLLMECDKHIHEKKDLFNDSNSNNHGR